MISKKLMAQRQKQLRGLLGFANDRLEELRRQWEQNDMSEAWLATLTDEDRAMLRGMSVQP